MHDGAIERPSEFERLVEAAPQAAPGMQRHRNDAIGIR
jgi:hypothetical protein